MIFIHKFATQSELSMTACVSSQFTNYGVFCKYQIKLNQYKILRIMTFQVSTTESDNDNIVTYDILHKLILAQIM